MSDEQFLTSEESPGAGAAAEDEGGATTTAQRRRTVPSYRVKRGLVPTELVVEEVAGRPPVDIEEPPPEAAAADHDEVSADAAETIEDTAAATEMEADVPAENDAFNDLRGIEGFQERGAETAPAEAPTMALPDAGTALAGGQEFLPFAGALASTVIPMLASKAGPAIARKVVRRLSPKVRTAVRRHVKGSNILSIAARLLESAETASVPAGEAGVDVLVDDAVVDEITQVLEVIIGTDDRVRILATHQLPWRHICALRIQMPSGANYRGTGFFIGPRAVATAGHCVFIRNQGGWARRIEVIPGSNGAQRPFGASVATSFRSVGGWVNSGKPETDYGCVVLPRGAFGGNFGHFGFAAFPSPQLMASTAVLAGYPGDKPFAELWGMGRRIKTVTPAQLIYDIDTMGGQSGAPVYIMKNGKRYVVGIHNYGAATGNSATRITSIVFKNLDRWKAIT